MKPFIIYYIDIRSFFNEPDSYLIAGCWRLGMATTTPANGEKRLSDAWACQRQCQSKQRCKFVQWNNSTRICQFLHGEIEEIYKDKESLLAARDCKNIALLWKKKPITTSTTIATIMMTPTKTSNASTKQEHLETWPTQNSTSKR
jgi:hypothetical protein